MKKILSLLTLLLCVCGSAWADTYTDEASTVTWAFTSHESLGSTNSPADAFLSTNFTYGSNLNLSTFNTKGCKAGWDEYNLVYFKPTTAVAKNAADAAENMLEWTITPAQGICRWNRRPTSHHLRCLFRQHSRNSPVKNKSEQTRQRFTNYNRPFGFYKDIGFCSKW